MSKKIGLYPEILFHFTDRLGLFGILESNFKVSYARERIEGLDLIKSFGVPMVSFCDLRLSELKTHIDNYRDYGIGLSKDWANKNGLNPVMYMNSKCPSTDLFLKSVEDIYNKLENDNSNSSYNEKVIAYMGILNMFRYMKNYEGTLIRPNKWPKQNYRFANEREWRFVPPLATDIPAFVPIDDINTSKKKQVLNQKISHIQLFFEPEDIKYLIVKEDSERLELLDHLEHVKRHFNPSVRRRLASRILTVEQIKYDV